MSTTEARAAAERVAIACAIKDTELTDLKRSLPRGESIQVNVVARIKGLVQIGMDTPGSSGERPARVDLRNADGISEALRRLKVTPTSLRRVLRAIVKAGHDESYAAGDENAALLAVFDQVADELTSTLPPVPFTTPGRAGAVRVDATVQVLDPPAAKAA